MDHDSGAHPRDALNLHDRVALDEIDLYTEVLIAVADAEGPLSPAEIDHVLGVVHGSGPGTAAESGPLASPPPAAGSAGAPHRTVGADTAPPPEPRPGGTGGGRSLPDTDHPLLPEPRLLPEPTRP
ncbi:hypothetical protein, partial [Nocardiopsis lucentensis]|uniref:hypothetical protein n=1 Tax=Nocardiopsis lucentensis TaxID=53441 RepID=UPI000592A008